SACHNASERKGGLDLTRRETALKGGRSGPVIVPGKPAESLLIERVTAASMPPKKSGSRLSKSDVEQLTTSGQRGAHWPADRVLSPFELTTDRRAGYDWWSLQPLLQAQLPTVQHQDWPRNPIDQFVLNKLESRGLSPSPEADRVTYLRRAKFDL